MSDLISVTWKAVRKIKGEREGDHVCMRKGRRKGGREGKREREGEKTNIYMHYLTNLIATGGLHVLYCLLYSG